MFSREKYCAVCGCLFSLPTIRDPDNPDPDEDPLLAYSDPYDARVLPRELIQWLTDFRVVGRWADIEPLYKNESTTPGCFLSGPADWEYKIGAGEPAIPTTEGKTEKIVVYEAMDEADGMLFPIHQACLDIVERICHLRQNGIQHAKPHGPQTLEAFCHAFQQRRWKNLSEPDRSREEDYYYAKSGGIEWPHDYYGARQFWADEWNTEVGWELLCADPSPSQIPDLPAYIISEVLEPSPSPASNPLSEDQIADRLGWLFPEEVRSILKQMTRHPDWDKGTQMLLEKADAISGAEGGEDEGNKKLASVPLGLKNRWRVWKILQGVT